MKSLLLTINIVLLLSLSLVARSQVYPVINGFSIIATYPYYFSPLSPSYDTTGANLWKIGSTTKPFFALGGAPINSIMTDTVNAYPVNANNSFVLKFQMFLFNPIVEITHKYQTTAHHDGCIVEFSSDSGSTWKNIIGMCSTFYPYGGINADSFYSPSDTLITGEPSFSGTSNGWVTSRVQFFTGFPIKKVTSGPSNCRFPIESSIVYLRFRFVSDSVSENLDGWIIRSIRLRQDNYGNSVAQINADNSLNIFPNPSVSGKFTFPSLTNQKDYTMYITDVLGRTVFHTAYKEQVDLSSCTQGVYFYRITNNIESYSGKLMKE